MKTLAVTDRYSWVENKQPVLISKDLSQMLFIFPMLDSVEKTEYPQLVLAELGEEDRHRELTTGKVEVRSVVAWDEEEQIV